MRIPLPTDLKTRTGAPDKDARQKNSYVETKGEGAIVRKRPSAQGGIPIGAGVAQGGIGLNINGTPYFIGFWADTMQAYTGGGGTWNAGTSYSIGGEVWIVEDENGDPITTPPDDPFDERYTAKKYYAQGPNTNKNPSSNPNYWGLTQPPSTRFYATGHGYDFPSPPGVGYIGPTCATALAAVQGVYDMLNAVSCPGIVESSYSWLLPPLTYGGGFGSAHAWTTHGHGTDCSFALDFGATEFCVLTQTA